MRCLLFLVLLNAAGSMVTPRRPLPSQSSSMFTSFTEKCHARRIFLSSLVIAPSYTSVAGAATSVMAETSKSTESSTVGTSSVVNADKITACAELEQRLSRLLAADPALAGTFLRLAFHDSVTRDGDTGGPNGSIRLQEELSLRDNRHLDIAVTALNELLSDSRTVTTMSTTRTPLVERLSFADAVVVAGAVAVTWAGGPQITVDLGRSDAATPDPELLRPFSGLGGSPKEPLPSPGNRSAVATALPSAGLDSDGLRNFFRGTASDTVDLPTDHRRFGLSDREIVALCGAHTLGRHASLLGVSKECLKNLTDSCIETGKRLPFVGDSQEPVTEMSPGRMSADVFDNSYFVRLLQWNNRQLARGAANFIPTDVVLVVDFEFRRIVEEFAQDEDAFFREFAAVYRHVTAPASSASSSSLQFTTTSSPTLRQRHVKSA